MRGSGPHPGRVEPLPPLPAPAYKAVPPGRRLLPARAGEQSRPAAMSHFSSSSVRATSYRRIFGAAPAFSPASYTSARLAPSARLLGLPLAGLGLLCSYCAGRGALLLHSSTLRPAYGGGERLDFSLAEALNQEFLATGSNEKQELQELNDHFASFIEKVCYLETQNAALLAEQSKKFGEIKTVYQTEGPASSSMVLSSQHF